MDKPKNDLVMIASSVAHHSDYLAEILESHGYETIIVKSARLALETLETEKPDLVIIDSRLPDMDGCELCRSLRQGEGEAGMPVLMLLADPGSELVSAALASGAADYISKPFNGGLIMSRVNTLVELYKNRAQLKEYVKILKYTNVELHAANQLVVNANDKLHDAIERAEIVARRDYLTGLYNRLYMTERIQDEISRFNRSGKHFGIIIGDIDSLKRINESYGQECGDQVLKEVAQVMQKEIRAQDSLGRWGGEEFILILPETGVCGAAVAAEKIREAVAGASITHNGSDVAVTMTFGVYFYDGYLSIDQALSKADSALMEGKDKGKNAVVMAE